MAILKLKLITIIKYSEFIPYSINFKKEILKFPIIPWIACFSQELILKAKQWMKVILNQNYYS